MARPGSTRAREEATRGILSKINLTTTRPSDDHHLTSAHLTSAVQRHSNFAASAVIGQQSACEVTVLTGWLHKILAENINCRWPTSASNRRRRIPSGKLRTAHHLFKQRSPHAFSNEGSLAKQRLLKQVKRVGWEASRSISNTSLQEARAKTTQPERSELCPSTFHHPSVSCSFR